MNALEFSSVYTKQQRIAQLAEQSPQMAFTSLAYHMDLEWLNEAYRRTGRSQDGIKRRLSEEPTFPRGKEES